MFFISPGFPAFATLLLFFWQILLSLWWQNASSLVLSPVRVFSSLSVACILFLCSISFPAWLYVCLFIYLFPVFVFLISLRDALLLWRRGNIVSWGRAGRWSAGITDTRNSPPSACRQCAAAVFIAAFSAIQLEPFRISVWQSVPVTYRSVSSSGIRVGICLVAARVFEHHGTHIQQRTQAVLLCACVTFCSYHWWALHYLRLSVFSLGWSLH